MIVSVRRLVLLALPIAASVAWAFVVFVYSTDPAPPGVAENAGRLDFLPRPDLFVHFGMYGLLSLFLILSLLPIRIERPLMSTGLPVLIAGLYGISLEFVQNTIPERSGSFDDGVVDVLGAIAAVVFVFVVRRVFHLEVPRSAA